MEHGSRHGHEDAFESVADNLSESEQRSASHPANRHNDRIAGDQYSIYDFNDHNDFNDCNDYNDIEGAIEGSTNPTHHTSNYHKDHNPQSTSWIASTPTSSASISRRSLESARDPYSNQNHTYPSRYDHPAPRPSLSSRTSSFSSDTDDSLPATPLSARFTISAANEIQSRTSSETPRTSLDLDAGLDLNSKTHDHDQTPRKRSDSLEVIRAKGCSPHESVIRTPPNARLTKLDRELLSEPSASLLRPTTFWRHHPLSPHSLPHHSPSSRLIRRSLLIASPTIGIQQPDPDAETTRIAIGLAGLDLDIDPRRRGINLLPI
ncbi:hypothetical protein IAU59_004855 [Kwoniella sp. CBS 9459]